MSRVRATVTSVLNNRHTLFRWFGKGFWAIMDQGLFAVSNFVLNVMLARWLTSADYGAFAVAYTVFLFLGTFHGAIVIEPMLIFGSAKYKGVFSSYLNVVLQAHWGFTIGVGLLLSLTGLFIWFFNGPLANIIFVLAITSPFILFQWIMRKSCYIKLQPQLAAQSGMIYLVSALVGAYALHNSGWLSATSVLFIMAIASFTSGILLFYRVSQLSEQSSMDNLAKNALLDHWNYGKWAIGASVLTYIPNNLFYFVLPIWEGLEAAGALRALSNTAMPILHMNTALGVILLPTFVRSRVNGTFYKSFIVGLSFLTMTSLMYWIVLLLFGKHVFNWLYGAQYDNYASLVVIYGLIPIVASFDVVVSRALRAMEKPNLVFFSRVGATAISLTFGIGCVLLFGIQGAIYGVIFSLTTASFISGCFLFTIYKLGMP